MARFLHTRIRVGDLDTSVKWYCSHLGFTVRSRTERSPQGNHIALLELPGNEHLLELTWSENHPVHVPEDLMHLAVGVPDVIAVCDRIEKSGVVIWPDGWRHTFPTGRKMAFITDPDGYEVEIVEG